MKKPISGHPAVRATVLAMAAAGCVAARPMVPPPVMPPPPAASPGFYEALSPYGEWIYVEDVGNVWRPSPVAVGPDFVPYQTGGLWEYTDYGWAFASDYAWGWGPFHYGRWFFSGLWGWLWVPDLVWGPAWVDWRYGGGYVGWAPLPPASLHHRYRPSWCFVQTRHFVDRDPGFHRASPVESERAFYATQPLPPARSLPRGESEFAGPPRARVAEEARVEVRQSRLERPKPLTDEALRLPLQVTEKRPVKVEMKPGEAVRVPGGVPMPLELEDAEARSAPVLEREPARPAPTIPPGGAALGERGREVTGQPAGAQGAPPQPARPGAVPAERAPEIPTPSAEPRGFAPTPVQPSQPAPVPAERAREIPAPSAEPRGFSPSPLRPTRPETRPAERVREAPAPSAEPRRLSPVPPAEALPPRPIERERAAPAPAPERARPTFVPPPEKGRTMLPPQGVRPQTLVQPQEQPAPPPKRAQPAPGTPLAAPPRRARPVVPAPPPVPEKADPPPGG